MGKLVKRVMLGIVVLLLGAGVAMSVASGNPERNRQWLVAQVTDLGALLASPDVRAEGVSDWSVYEQVEHLLLANQSICALIEADTPPDPVVPKTFVGKMVLTSGYIPRGQGQAPTGTVPEARSRDQLLELHGQVEAAVAALDPGAISASDHVVGNHPVFGGFTAEDWLRLMVVHDVHHLKIVKDIQLAAGPGPGAP